MMFLIILHDITTDELATVQRPKIYSIREVLIIDAKKEFLHKQKYVALIYCGKNIEKSMYRLRVINNKDIVITLFFKLCKKLWFKLASDNFQTDLE